MRGIWLALGCIAVASCSLLVVTPPTTRVQWVDLEAAPQGVQVLVALCVANPNRRAIPFRRLHLAVKLAAAPVATSEKDEALQMPPYGAVFALLSFRTNLLGAGARPELLKEQGLPYTMNGTVEVADDVTATFSHTGRLVQNSSVQILDLMDSSPEVGAYRCPPPQ